MEFKEFTEYVAENIKKYLPERYSEADVQLGTVEKLNCTYTSLNVFTGDEGISPAIDLNNVYRSSENDVIENVMEEIASIITNNEISICKDIFEDYNLAKNKLFIRVSNFDRNREYLEKMPHRKVMDLAITYHILADILDGAVGSTPVTNDMMSAFGIAEERLHNDAILNSEKVLLPEVLSLESVLEPEHMPFNDSVERYRDGNELLILSNDKRMYGASAIFYPGIMEKIVDTLGTSVFVIPSSIHEVLLIPDKGLMELSAIQSMVMDVNETAVEPEMFLSNNVYYYDIKTKELTVAGDDECIAYECSSITELI